MKWTSLPLTSALKPTPEISRPRSYPLTTPSTAFLTSVRVRPCRPLARRDSSGRAIFTSPFSTTTVMSGFTGKDILPFGPSTFTTCPSTETFTFSGTLTGILPTRDMARSLPYQTVQISSPPTFCLRASRSAITPLDVERMAMPIPLRTRGMESVGT